MLEQRDAPVAVVEAIAGATRAEVAFTGRAGHAGTVPMAGRRDAACGLAEFVLAVEAAGRADGRARGDRRAARGAARARRT